MIIGITTTLNKDEGIQRVNVEYVHSVAGAGAVPVLLTPVPGGAEANRALAHQVLDMVDALVLSGGGDVHPRFYGGAADDNLEDLTDVNEVRDEFELELARLAHERGVPCLGICRGTQVMNVALGGTLHRDLRADGATEAQHRQEPPYDVPTGEVEVAADSQLSHALEVEGALTVNSMHHQGIDAVAAPLTVVALSADDAVVEGVEDPALPFFVGVQWHPEYLEAHQGLFRALVAATLGRNNAS